jgi:hypothetical protein
MVVIFQRIFINVYINSPLYIGFDYSVLESRRVEGDIRRHVSSILLAAVRVTTLRHYHLKDRVPRAVAGFAVVEADAEIRGLGSPLWREDSPS